MEMFRFKGGVTEFFSKMMKDWDCGRPDCEGCTRRREAKESGIKAHDPVFTLTPAEEAEFAQLGAKIEAIGAEAKRVVEDKERVSKAADDLHNEMADTWKKIVKNYGGSPKSNHFRDGNKVYEVPA